MKVTRGRRQTVAGGGIPADGARRRRARDRGAPAGRRRRGRRRRHAVHLRHRQRAHPPGRARRATISTVAGGGDPDALGDGGPATARVAAAARAASRWPPTARSTSPTTGRDRVRRVTPDGRITTAAGGGSGGLGDGGRPRRPRSTCRPTSRSTPTGTLYIADALHHRVRAVTARAHRHGRRRRRRRLERRRRPGDDARDRPAATASTSPPTAPSTSPTASHHSSAGSARTARSPPTPAPAAAATTGDGGAPLQARLSFPEDVTVAPDGSLLIADTGNARVRRAALGLPGFVDADFSLPDPRTAPRSSSSTARPPPAHGATRSPAPRGCSFAYDAAGRLITRHRRRRQRHHDRARRRPARRRRSSRPATVRTALTLRPDGCSATVTERRARGAHARLRRRRPAEDVHGPARPRRALHLRRAHRPAEDRRGQARLSRPRSTREPTATGFRVTRTSDMSRSRVFEAEQLPGGGTRSTTTDPSGARSPSCTTAATA